MTFWFIRGFFFVIITLVGYFIGSLTQMPQSGFFIGLVSAVVLIVLEVSLRHVSLRGLTSAVFGLLLGIFLAKLVSDIIALVPLGAFYHSVIRVILTLIFSYLCVMMALRGKDEFNLIIPYIRFRRQDVKGAVVLLDTSAIIDGRIADIYKTHFFTGRIVVPRFVLRELQNIADSSDDMKRQRGRRGIEILRNMQKDRELDVRIHEEDLPEGLDVDTKLVQLARLLEARICTTDFNLNQVADIQGIEILNVNALANAVKTVVLPGEDLCRLRLIKEGKEANQAVAYLDDGTMVVVAGAKKMVGKTVDVLVTSALQTQAGKMIFAKLKK
jgi:uncharacterized protein YacL